jgi:RNA-binding protein YlmH
MEKEEQIFRNRIQELAELSYKRDIPANSDFLNLNEQAIFQSMSGTLPPVRFVLSGGFLASERKVVCFLPSYEETLNCPPYDCLKIAPVNPRFAESLTHRDYLGALMNLGIERAMIGDIVIKGQDAYVFVLKKMSGYVADSLVTVRHTSVSATVFEGDGDFLEPEYEEIAGTVSSVRLDSIVALCGRLSRTKAADYIESERVSVNGLPVTSCSRSVKEGEVLSVRGIGKFRFEGAGAQTKKGRTSVKILKYK